MAQSSLLEQYEDDEANRRRLLSNAQVLRFIGGYWARRPWLVFGTIALVTLTVAFETFLPQASRALVDAATRGPKFADGAWRAWLVFIGIYFGFAGMRNMSFRLLIPLSASAMREMTDEGFARVQSFSSSWHGATFSGATVRRLSRAMWGYDSATDAMLIGILPAILVLLGLSIQMMVRWPLVGLASLIGSILFVAINVALTISWVQKANVRSVAFDSRIGGALADSISSNATVKAFGAEAREEARIARVLTDWRTATMRAWSRGTDVWLVQNLLMWMLQASLTGLMVLRWSKGAATAGDVAFVITAFLVMAGYLRTVGENIRMLQKGLADVEDVAGYSHTPPQVADQSGSPDFVGLDGVIVFEGVTFGYGEGSPLIYQDFNLRVRAGERIALVGPTGSGKSTFVKLIQRLYDLEGGRIVIDGQDIAAVTQRSLRRAIAVVPQDPALFHRTIAENIAYSRPGATSDEIVLAAKRAHAHAFIEALSKGYDTLVGERGVKLSGGERQRVAIARALLADAPILVLDEATSSLDVETEAEVQAATEAVMAGRTTILIAHRLSTIRGADRILVFQDGRIVEEGRHGDLVAKGGAYARLNAVATGV